MRRPIELNSLALKTRKIFGEDAYSPIDIVACVNGWTDRKITIVYYPLSERVSGMCTKINKNVVICINSGTSYGRQRFTLAHELYHILYEEGMQRVVCDMSLSGEKSDSEQEADLFATFLLMPYDALHEYADQKKMWTLREVIEAEQFFKISHQAMLLRLREEEYITSQEYDCYQKIKVTREAIMLGYSNELYRPSEEGHRYFTIGEYIRKVEKLAEMNRISEGKREEMLMDAFRPDIVYNIDAEEGMDIG